MNGRARCALVLARIGVLGADGVQEGTNRSVRGPQGEDRVGRVLAQLNALVLRLPSGI